MIRLCSILWYHAQILYRRKNTQVVHGKKGRAYIGIRSQVLMLPLLLLVALLLRGSSADADFPSLAAAYDGSHDTTTAKASPLPASGSGDDPGGLVSSSGGSPAYVEEKRGERNNTLCAVCCCVVCGAVC